MAKLAHLAEVLSNTLQAKNAPDCFIFITWAISGFIFVKYMQREERQVLISELFSTF